MKRHLRPFGLNLSAIEASAIFLPVQFLAVSVGLTLLVAPLDVAVFWPATGSLLAFLLLFPLSYWPALAVVTFVAELAAHWLLAPQVGLATIAMQMPVKLAAAMLGVAFMHLLVRGPVSFARLNHVLSFALAALVATFLGGVAAVIVGERGLGQHFWRDVQQWWIGDFLGALIVTPLLLTIGFHGFAWATRRHGSRIGTFLAFALLVMLLATVFLNTVETPRSPLDVPYIVYPVLVWIAMISGPRRIALAAGLAVGVASLATTRGLGPFVTGQSHDIIAIQLQTFLALCVLPVLLLQAVMAEREAAIEHARSSDERYRAFIANSSEAIFRTELALPMPVTLPPDDQIAWVKKHGFVAECNTAFMVALGIKEGENPVVGTRLGDHPTWSRIYVERIREAIKNGYHIRNIEHVVHGPYGLDRVLLISMVGIVEKGMVLASELHDGPAQNLAGMAMQLAELKRLVADRLALERLAETEQVLADTTLQTRTLMLELAPPGLHENGLIEALRWLGDRTAKQQRLIVTVEDDGLPKPLEDQVTVLLFQTVRELLQNVVKHSRSKRATVRCSVAESGLQLDVIDPGVGFEVNSIERLPTRHGGFGLFSIRERLKLMGGKIEIHSVIGQGTTVRIRVPLKPQHGLFDEALRA
jgi:integral membrane sensor domain MASE1